MTTNALNIHELSKSYGATVQALDKVSLSIPTGMFGLLGPNGAGKSTLMRIIATLQEADRGSVTLDLETGDGPGGRTIDVLRERERVRRVLGYLPQEFGLYPKVPARAMLDHLALLKGISRRKERREVVNALLRRANLWEVRDRRLGTFSGGMKQRFGIAQAMLGDPRLIVVDEPTAGLDPEERIRFHNLLSEIGENVIVILSTHIVEDVSQLCQQMAIIDSGRVLLSCGPVEAIRRMQGQVWRKTIDRDDEAAYEERYAVLATKLFAGRLVVRVLADAAPDPSFSEAEPTLEDVYFATIKLGRRAVSGDDAAPQVAG
jgi:ABC-type multidrug transport system ATPase subunit